MLIDVTSVEVLENHRLRLSFADGSEGVVDVAGLVTFTGVFGPLADPAEFSRAAVHTELGTVCWPCGADLDPDVLYALATGRPLGLDGAETQGGQVSGHQA